MKTARWWNIGIRPLFSARSSDQRENSNQAAAACWAGQVGPVP
ncbi:hypothetical protein [Actinomadura rugatobispora]|uniref:Uncharacterized protein n=1 Tax=Actinomadura rugatobispora TaxID=1994 RepID=A0ABW0ZST0_9ACTN